MLCISACCSCAKTNGEISLDDSEGMYYKYLHAWSSADSADSFNSAISSVMSGGNPHLIWIVDSLGFLNRRKK